MKNNLVYKDHLIYKKLDNLFLQETVDSSDIKINEINLKYVKLTKEEKDKIYEELSKYSICLYNVYIDDDGISGSYNKQEKVFEKSLDCIDIETFLNVYHGEAKFIVSEDNDFLGLLLILKSIITGPLMYDEKAHYCIQFNNGQIIK